MPNFEVNIDSQIPNLSKANVATLIGSSTLSNQKLYIIVDAEATDNERIAVMATSNNTLSTVALNLTTNEFGNYDINTDVFIPLDTGSGTEGAILDVTVAQLQALQTAGTINPKYFYRVTDATPVRCIVAGYSVNESSALAFLEGSSDGTGITSLGGTGTYNLQTGTFSYGFVFDSVNSITYIGVNPSANTVGTNCTSVIFMPNSFSNTVGDNSTTITFEINSGVNSVGNGSVSITFEKNCGTNIVGNNSNCITFGKNISYFTFGNNFQNCTIWPNLNGSDTITSLPIDFITGVTFLYNRTSPWEIRDIDRTNELLFLYVTYGDGSDPEEGWYDPATDTFTPSASGGGVATVTGTAVDNTDPVNPVINKQIIPYQNSASHGTIGGTTTRFGYLLGGYNINLTTSSQAVLYFNTAGTFNGGRVRTNSAQSANGSLVFTLLYGSNPASLSSSGIVLTVAAGSAAGVFTSANTQAISSGVYACWQITNNANVASAQIADGYTEFIPS